MNFMKKMKWLELDKHGHQGSQEIFQLKLHLFFISITTAYYCLPNGPLR